MPGRRDHSRRLLGFARQMRKEPTDAERKMWQILRRERIAGFRFRRQVPISGFIADFCCFRANVIIEVDGGQHRDEAAIKYDDLRTAKFAERGLRVLRFPADKVLKIPEKIEDFIYDELTKDRGFVSFTGPPNAGDGVASN